MVGVYQKKKKHYTDLTILTAAEEVRAGGKNGMSRKLITNRLKENAGIRKRKKPGRKTALPVEKEE